MLAFKKVGLVSLPLLLLAFLSCTTQSDVPLVYAYKVTPTTTTTLKPSVTVVKQGQPTSDILPAVTLPSVLEPELRNLYASAYESYKELLSYEISAIFPVPASELMEKFEKVRINYEVQIWRWPYNGEASYPFFMELKVLGQQLSALVEKGLPIKSETERVKALNASDLAKTNKVSTWAVHRVVDAEAALGSGNTFHTAAKYRSSIAFFKKAGTIYASASARAAAEKAKTDHEASGLNRFSPFLKMEADRLMAEDSSLYALSDNDSITKGISQLNWATRLYNQAISWGIECQASEERDRALITKRHAVWDFADTNAKDEFTKASTLFADAEAKQKSGEFIEAATLFKNSIISFEAAQAAARLVAGNARIAREVAEMRLNYQKARIEASGFEKDASFLKAEFFLTLADEKLLATKFENSRLDSMEVLNHLALSDKILEQKLSEKRAAEQAEMERKALEQAKLLAQKQAEIEALIREKVKIEEKLTELEKRLSDGLIKNPAPIKTSDQPSPAEEMQTAAKRLEVEHAKLEQAVASAKAEVDRLAAERLNLERAGAEAKAEADRLAAERANLERKLLEQQIPLKPKEPEAKVIIPEPAQTQPTPSEPLPPPVTPTPVTPTPETPLPAPLAPEPLKPEKPMAESPAIQEPIAPKATPVPTKSSGTGEQAAEKIAIEAEIEAASKKLEWAISKNAANNYPAALSKGKAELEAAISALGSEDLTAASAKVKAALGTFSGIAEFAELPRYYHVGALPGRNGVDSLSKIAGYAFIYGDPLKWPFLYSANKGNMPDPANPDLIKWNQAILIPSIKGEIRNGTWDPKKTYRPFDKTDKPPEDKNNKEFDQAKAQTEREAARAQAQTALETCRKAYDQALGRNAKNNYPSLLETGARDMALAETAYKSGDFQKSKLQADSARQTLAAIKEFAPLPARYTVRRMPSVTDSYWQIAGYPFIYGNSYRWQKLYEANRSLHAGNSNPTLLLPGDVITIPSLSGEVREGMWDQKKTYPPLPK